MCVIHPVLSSLEKFSLLIIPFSQVVQGEPPRLLTSYNGMEFSKEFVDFVNTW